MSPVLCNHVLFVLWRSWIGFKGKGWTVITIWPLICLMGGWVGFTSNGWAVGIKNRGGGPLAQAEDEDSYVCMNRHWSSLSSTLPAPPRSQPNIKWPPTQSGGGIFIQAHTQTAQNTQIHMLAHILFCWSDDIINNHYWDTRKCRDLRLRVWPHGIRLACCRWEIWRGKHPPKLFYLWISLIPQC